LPISTKIYNTFERVKMFDLKTRFLFGIMHPRRLDFFLESLKALDYVDILLAKNMEMVEALKTIKNVFLKGDYDYLLLTSDDITIPYLAPYKIMKDVGETGYDIITGWSRVGKLANISRPKVNENIEKWTKKGIRLKNMYPYTVNEIEDMLKEGKGIIPVWLVGWSITAMSRRVVENWTPRGWVFLTRSKWKPATYQGEKGKWWQADIWFSYETWKKGFKKYADLTVRIPHTKSKLKTMMVGKKPPEVKLIKARKKLSEIS